MSRLSLSVLVAVLAALALLPAGASASSKQVMTFEAPRELLSDATRDRTLDEITAFGVRRIRILMYWDRVAPSPNSKRRPAFDAADPNAYGIGWAEYDNLFQAAQQRGLEVYVTLTGGAPRWATKSKRDHITRPSAKEFGLFATAAGRRFGDRVAIWSIWNEPNQPQFLLPQFRKGKAYSPKLYRGLYKAARKGLDASGNGDDTILIGETSPRGNSRIVAPLAFLRGVLCLNARYKKSGRCGKLAIDGYAHHPYTTIRGPKFKPPKDDVTIGVLSRLTKALDRAARAKAVPRGLGLYLTEFGIQSKPDPYAVSTAQQAEFMAISEQIAYRNKRVKTFSQYLMSDDDPHAGGERYGGFESGLRKHNGSKKPAYDGFRTPLAVHRSGGKDSGWGLVRPATGSVQVEIRYRGKGKRSYKRLRTLTTAANGVFKFKVRAPKGRRYQVVWTAPDGTVWSGPPIRAYR
ncbi:MAG TPA: family 1 glycosylhydrolase [Solirubrobacteraceae bacterium]